MDSWNMSTSDPAVASLLVSIRNAIVTVTGSSLVGLYLFGSLATGDFDAEVSDRSMRFSLVFGNSGLQDPRAVRRMVP